MRVSPPCQRGLLDNAPSVFGAQYADEDMDLLASRQTPCGQTTRRAVSSWRVLSICPSFLAHWSGQLVEGVLMVFGCICAGLGERH